MLVIDLEGTCCDDGSIPPTETETIEIGAVWVRSGGIQEFSSFVRPVRHPRLTAFCTKLTSISQADVNAADGFEKAFMRLAQWSQFHDSFASWGTYDKSQLLRDCDWHRLAYRFTGHVDLARVFKRATGHKCGHRRAMKHLGIEPTGTHHRGIDDARNIARIAIEMAGRGWVR